MSTLKFWQPNELLAVLGEARKQSARNHCLILLGYKHGLRATELCRLTVSDVRAGRLDCRRLKGSLHTNRPLESNENPLLDEKRALAAWLSVRPDDGSMFLFTSRLGSGMTRRSIYNIFEDAAAAARIEPGRRNPHMAKHTLGALGYRSGLDVIVLQQLLGHKDLKATSFYTSLSQDEAHQAGNRSLSKMFAPAA
jgi:site-specific recombinase XerD